MAYLWLSGAELNSASTNVEAIVTGTVAVSSTTKRTGDYAWRMNPSAATGYISIRARQSAADTMLSSFWINIASAPSAQTTIIRHKSGTAGSAQISIKLNTDRTLTIHDNVGTQVGSASSAIATDTWTKVAMYGTNPSAGNGTGDGRLNGSSFSSWTNTGSDVDATNYVDIGIIDSTTADIYIDDIVVVDTNSFPANEGIVHMQVDSAGNSAGWDTALGGGAHYLEVDEVTPDDATSYIENIGTTGDIDDFNLEAASAAGISASDTITAVGVGVRWYGSTSSQQIDIGVSDDGTTYSTTIDVENDVTATYRTNGDSTANAEATGQRLFSTLLPSDGVTAWSPTTLSAAHVRVTSSTTGTLRVTDIWLAVLFTDNAEAGTAVKDIISFNGLIPFAR